MYCTKTRPKFSAHYWTCFSSFPSICCHVTECFAFLHALRAPRRNCHRLARCMRSETDSQVSYCKMKSQTWRWVLTPSIAKCPKNVSYQQIFPFYFSHSVLTLAHKHESLVRHCSLNIVGGSVAVNQKSMINRLTNELRFDIHCCRLVIRMNANNENGRFHLFFVESSAPSQSVWLSYTKTDENWINGSEGRWVNENQSFWRRLPQQFTIKMFSRRRHFASKPTQFASKHKTHAQLHTCAIHSLEGN